MELPKRLTFTWEGPGKGGGGHGDRPGVTRGCARSHSIKKTISVDLMTGGDMAVAKMDEDSATAHYLRNCAGNNGFRGALGQRDDSAVKLGSQPRP